MSALWTCDACGKQAPWGPGWRWYGSISDIERTGLPEFVACSDACAATYKPAPGGLRR